MSFSTISRKEVEVILVLEEEEEEGWGLEDVRWKSKLPRVKTNFGIKAQINFLTLQLEFLERTCRQLKRVLE
jgi:hypothetical protein